MSSKSPEAEGPRGEEAPVEALLPFTVRRPVAKIGRNDPCHCGSGKKYKRCCLEKDRTRLSDPSPYPGLTMEEAKQDPTRHGDAAIFWEMSREERAGVDRTRLGADLLLGLFEAHLEAGELVEARAVLDAVVARGGPEAADLPHYRDVLIYEALRRGDLKLARAESALREGEETLDSALNRLTLDLGQRAPKVRRLEELVVEVLDDQASLADLADALSLARLPGLSLLATRAAAAIAGGTVDKVILDDLLGEQRRTLGLDENDPALWLTEVAGRPARRRRTDEEVDELRSTLREREAAIQRVRSERDRLAGELSRQAMVEPAAPQSPVPASDEEARRLRRKIDELQADLRHMQHERLDLRRQIRSTPAADETPARPPGEPEPPEEETGEPLPEDSAAQPVEFTAAFHETSSDFDGRLVLRAQEIAVRFAALDPATWKQAKKMADLTGVFTLRVGIHHRLFVTRRDGQVAARELVSRESFERTLKRYRR